MAAMIWITDALSGFREFEKIGRIIAPAVAVVLYLLFFRRESGNRKRLVMYGAGMAVLCICPVTAALLMMYQTRFYDYRWIWSAVPLSVLTAMGGALFLAEWYRRKTDGKRSKYVSCIVITLAVGGILLLCGNCGQKTVDADANRVKRTQAQEILHSVDELELPRVCLWAPADVLEYSRVDLSPDNAEGSSENRTENVPERELYYGRNMWDIALNAYSYDTYSEGQVALYEWMEHLDDWDIAVTVPEVLEYVRLAKAEGVNVMIFPTAMSEWLAESPEEFLQTLEDEEQLECSRVGNYYLLVQR